MPVEHCRLERPLARQRQSCCPDNPGMTNSVPLQSIATPDAALKAYPQSLADLFWSFTKLALQGFGGVVVVAQRELVEKKHWLTHEEFIEDWAVAQILPGPNVINLAVMMGDRSFGWRGAFAALAGMFTLPLMVVLAMAALFT